MEKMHVFFKSKFLNPVYIDKLGITIRPLTTEEIEDILLKFDNRFFSIKAKRNISKYLSLNGDINSFNYKVYESLSQEQLESGVICATLKKEIKDFNKNTIKKQLRKIALVEFNEKLTEYVEADLDYIFFSQIIKVLILIKTNISLTEVKDYNIISKNFNIFSEDIYTSIFSILNYINVDCPQILKEIDLDEKDFIMFNNFINTLKKDRIRDFIMIIDVFLSKSNSIDNILLNFVSSLERMLVKYEKNYDIGKQLMLKFGLCISDNTLDNIDYHLKNIRYCYEIRSCIVHGNDNELLNAPKKYLGINKKEIEEFISSTSHYKTRFTNIYLAKNYIENTIIILLKEWINNTKRIEFLKNN